MNPPYIYATIPSQPVSLPDRSKPEPEALKEMRRLSRDWPTCKWVAYQNVDLSSQFTGHLQFLAVGPGRGVPCVTHPGYPNNWRYRFVGFVNLETGLIESFTPTPAVSVEETPV